ncbi:hypothetical protein [Chlamydia sp. 17-3921]|uniref:CT529 family inclusion membrane protein n=1 Tax=Chlamydia sp. 17-3921 TaxID=2675798 RepID=UPI00191A7E29|nr:hypothetical protein [Chlamydia sp. 17-3921]
MTTTITKYALKLVTASNTCQQVTKKSASSNCFKQFFTNKNNRLAKFVNMSSGLDKTFKCGKSVSELALGILQETGGSAEAIKLAQNSLNLTKTARDVMALGNVFNGAIPGCVTSTQKCCSLLKQCFSSSPAYKYPTNDAFVLPKDFMVLRSDFALAAAKEACSAVGALTFSLSFGVLKPTLLVNKIAPTPFLGSKEKEGLGMGVSTLMAANHVSGVLGGALSIVTERRAYLRGRALLMAAPNNEEEGVSCNVDDIEKASQALRSSYIGGIKKAILTIIEKGLEFIADILKLIPFPMSAACNLACVGALTTGSSLLGIYKIWQSAGASK